MEMMTLLIINILQQHRVLIDCVLHQHSEESIYKSHLLCSRTCMFIDLTADQGHEVFFFSKFFTKHCQCLVPVRHPKGMFSSYLKFACDL